MSFPQRTYSPSPTTFLHLAPASHTHLAPHFPDISFHTPLCPIPTASLAPTHRCPSVRTTHPRRRDQLSTQPTRRAPCDGVACSSTAGLARSPAPLFPAPLPLVCLGPQPPPNCCPQPSPPNSCTHLRTQILCVVVRVDGSKETRADTGKELA